MNISKSNTDTVAFEVSDARLLNSLKTDHYLLPTKDVLKFIRKHINRFELSNILSAKVSSGLDFLDSNQPYIVNLQRINDVRHLNKFFERVNEKLSLDGIFIGCVETIDDRKQRIYSKFPRIVARPYYAMDFVLKRIFPKFSLTKKLYFSLTKGNNRVLSKPETLGRLVSCGFDIVEYEEINGKLYFVAKKKTVPFFDLNPSYGPLIKMKRVGKGGKIIYVYKIRTMHPYAEYMQKFIYDSYGTSDGVRFDNDFRVTSWGRMMRRVWLDEVPQLINFFKGDLKLVGVRPLSLHKFSIYPQSLQEKRIKYKPGLIPPAYVEIPKSIEDMVAIEEKYLDAYERHPFMTDWKYFWKAVSNILFKKVRSS
ncbi:MAG: sugar transferase [Ignavibacteria bacterium]|nr:sugar transferase [Ignavibacteria bacterium]